MASTAETLTQYIPNLRLFTRLITGSREASDAWIAQFLEETDANSLLKEKFPKKALFRALYRRGGDLISHCEANSCDSIQARLRETIQHLPPVDRQVLILVTVEQFSPEDAGEILGLWENEVNEHLSKAKRELKSELSGNVLVVGDPSPVTTDLSEQLRNMGFAKVTRISSHAQVTEEVDAEEQILLVWEHPVQNERDGIANIQEILKHWTVPIILVTPQPERFLHQDLPDTVFLLRNPYDAEVLRITVEQAFFNKMTH